MFIELYYIGKQYNAYFTLKVIHVNTICYRGIL